MAPQRVASSREFKENDHQIMRLQVARIGKPHGIRGEVTVQVLTDVPDDRFAPGEVLHVIDGPVKTLTVTKSRWNKTILLVDFAEIKDRNMAETFRQAHLEIEVTGEEESASDEWYEHELLDLKVIHDGKQVGVISALRTNPAQDLLVFKDLNGEEVYLPFVDEFVPDIDTEAGTVTITPPAGLLELNQGEEEK